MLNNNKERDKEAAIRLINTLKIIIASPTTIEAEKEAAIGRMEMLLLKYSILESELDKKDKIENEVIVYPRYTKYPWYNLLLFGIAENYNCHVLFTSFKNPDNPTEVFFSRAIIFGHKEDLSVAVTVIDFVFSQVLDKSDSLYEWACRCYNTPYTQLHLLKDQVQTQNFSFLFSNIFTITESYNMKSLLNSYGEMPERLSDYWLKLENDWGCGIVSRIILNIRCMQEESLKAKNDTQDAVFDNKDSNSIVLLKNQIAIQKQDAIKDHIENILGAKENLKLNTTVNHPFLFNKGSNEANSINVGASLNKIKHN